MTSRISPDEGNRPSTPIAEPPAVAPNPLQIMGKAAKMSGPEGCLQHPTGPDHRQTERGSDAMANSPNIAESRAVSTRIFLGVLA